MQFPLIVETANNPPKQIDHNNESDRIWLQRFIFWSMRNGQRVTLRPINNGADN